MRDIRDACVAGILLFLLVVATYGLWGVAAQAQTQSPLVSPGGRYIITFDCWPEWVTLIASAQVANGQRLNPCYADDVTVTRLRSDGWAEVELQGSTWLLNLDRATGIAVKPQTQAAR